MKVNFLLIKSLSAVCTLAALVPHAQAAVEGNNAADPRAQDLLGLAATMKAKQPVEIRATPTIPDFWEAATQLAAEQANASVAAPVAPEEEIRAQDLARTNVEMPPIWRLLKTYAYAQLPRHRRKEFEAVWAPVVVTGTDDTVPGLGLAGRF